MNNYDYKMVIHSSPFSCLTDLDKGCIQFLYSDTFFIVDQSNTTAVSGRWNLASSSQMLKLKQFAFEQDAPILLWTPSSILEFHTESLISQQGNLSEGKENCTFYPVAKCVEVEFADV